VDDLQTLTEAAWGDDLRAEVDRVFVRTGADTPGWPDPHPDRSPLDEEYSRVTDVGKYRILDARVDAWVEVLAERGVATATDVPAEPWVGGLRPASDHLRVRRLTPSAPGGLSFLIATTLVGGEPFGLDVGMTDGDQDPVLLAMVPDCGCDACDSGSADLLVELDEWILTVARGGVVHARRGSDTATRTWAGWALGNDADVSWLDDAAPADSRVVRWRGTAWGEPIG